MSGHGPSQHAGRQVRRRRQLNVPLLVGSLVALAVIIPVTYVWHQQQLRRVSEVLLAEAERFEQAGDDQQSVDYLFRCLQLSADDGGRQRDLTVRLARALDRLHRENPDKSTVIEWHYRAIGLDPDDDDLQVRLAQLFLETKQFVLAEQQAERLLRDRDGWTAVRRIRALARFGQLRQGRPLVPQPIRVDLEDALRAVPGDVEVAKALATVYREYVPAVDGAEPGTRADAVMDALVRNASDDWRAYLARYRYRVTYGLVVDERDLVRARELASTEPEVILASAQALQRQADWEAAGAQFQRLVERQPASFQGYLGLGETLYRQTRRAEALDTWRQGLRSVAGGRLPLHVRLIDGLIETNDLDAAQRQLEQLDAAIRYLATTEGEHQRDWVTASRDLLHAKILMRRDEYRQAVPLLQRVATTAKAEWVQDPESAPAYQAWLLLGETFWQLQQWEDAANSFQRALQHVPSSVTARLWAARSWMAVGRDDQALLLCEQAVARPGAPDNVWLILAQLHLRTQLTLPPEERRWDRLETVLRQAAQAMPDRWEIPLLRANATLLRFGRDGVGQVVQILATEEAAHPDSLALWANLVFVYERMALSREADRALARMRELAGDSAQPVAWQAALQASRGEYADARQLLERAQGQELRDEEALDRAELFVAYQQGDLERIRDVLLRLLSERPQGTELLVQLADLALAQANWIECDRWIAGLREAEGEDGIWWRFFQARRLLASQTEASGDPARVAVLYDEIRRRRPWWPGASVLRGLLAETQGRAEEAVEAYTLALRGGMQQPFLYEQLIRNLYRLGRFAEAEQWLRQLQQQAPLDARVLDLAWAAAGQRDQSDLVLRLARENFRQRPQEPDASIWLAQILWLDGQREAAKQQIQHARSLQPRDAASWTGLLSYYLRSGEPTEVEACLDVLREHPDLTPSQRASLAAQTYHQLGQRDAADRAYQEALQLEPDDPVLRWQYATFLRPLEPDRAEALLRETLLVAPRFEAARRTLATWLYASDSPKLQEEARELLTSSDGNWQQQSDNQRLEVMLLLRRGMPDDIKAARTLLERITSDARATSPEDRLLLARLYESENDLRKAEEQLQFLLTGDTPPARYLATYVDFLLRRERFDEARKHLQQLERQAPMSVSVVSLRSRLLGATGQADQIDEYLESFARQQLEQLKDNQQRQQFLLQTAELFAAAGRMDGAERWYRRLAQEYPDSREPLMQFWVKQDKLPQALEYAWQNLQRQATPTTAALYARMIVRRPGAGEINSQAESLLEDVLRRFPDDASLLFSMASLRLKQGRTSEAIELLRRLTEAHPTHVTGWNNLAAVLADDAGQLDEALACVDRAINAADRPVANLLDTKAVILLRMDRNAEAARLMHRALALDEAHDARYHLHLALAQQRLGQTAAARSAWRRALALGLSEPFLTEFEQQMVRQLQGLFGNSPSTS